MSEAPACPSQDHDGNEGEGKPFLSKAKDDAHDGKWRAVVKICAYAAVVVSSINTAALIYAAVHVEDSSPYGTIIEGDCTKIRHYNTVTHLFVNILSTILLVSSNYCMQCLAAPSRSEIDAAHSKQVALEIGVPSLTNLFHIRKMHVALWSVLALSSAPLHLLYNSAIFATQTVNEYVVYNVNEAFVGDAPFDPNATFEGQLKYAGIAQNLYQTAKSGELQRLDILDCVNAYASTFQAKRSHVLLVSNASLSASDPVYGDPNAAVPAILNQGYSLARDNLRKDRVLACDADTYAWICNGANGTDRTPLPPELRYSWHKGTCPKACTALLPGVKADPNRWEPLGHQVEYCLSQEVPEACKLRYSLALIAIVLLCNLCKASLMLYLAFGQRIAPLLTLGDAVSSFLDAEDPTTKDSCTFSYLEFTTSKKQPSWKRPQSRPYLGSRGRWLTACSTLRWVAFGTVFVLSVIACLALHLFAWKTNKTLTVPMAWKMGLSGIHSFTIIQGPGLGNTLLSTSLLANLPQLVLSIIYFLYNGVMTSMMCEREWRSFAYKTEGLRVSSRERGFQKSEYRVQIPYKYSIAATILSIGVHWLSSQSIFVVALEYKDVFGKPYVDEKFYIPHLNEPDQFDIEYYTSATTYALGWSPMALLLTIITGLVIGTYLVALGFRRFQPGLPLARNSSAVISAACHPDRSREPEDIAACQLRWGVADDGTVERAGHCSFTTLRSCHLPLTEHEIGYM